MKRVWVKWRDAATYNMWVNIQDAKESKPRICQACGFLVSQDASNTIIFKLIRWLVLETEYLQIISFLKEQ